jgi:tetratricopeptide (TPR) repeat protein
VTSELEVLLRRAGDLFLLQWTVFERSMIPFASGDWDKARAGVEEALVLARRSGRRGYEAWYLAHLGWIARLQGRLEDAVAHGRRSIEAPITIHTWFRSTACAMQAVNLLARGQQGAEEEAFRLLEAGLAAAEQSGAEGYRLRCLAPLAELTGDVRMLRSADDLLSSARFPQGTAWLHGLEAYLSLARAWRDAGDGPRARSIVTEICVAGEAAGWGAVLTATGATELMNELSPGRRPQNRSASKVAARRAPSPGTVT